jgi:hypothetical protein
MIWKGALLLIYARLIFYGWLLFISTGSTCFQYMHCSVVGLDICFFLSEYLSKLFLSRNSSYSLAFGSSKFFISFYFI